MSWYAVRALLLLLVGSLSMAACGGDDGDPVSTALVSESPSTLATDPVEVSAETPDDDPTTPVEQVTTTEEATATELPAAAEIDWLNTTYRMQAYPGSDMEDLAFVDGGFLQTAIVAMMADPADPTRVAMVSTSADSEGFPLVVGAGIFRLDGAGIAQPEALTSTMSGHAYAVALCPSELSWDGSDTLSLELATTCEHGQPRPRSARWTREGEALHLDESGLDGGGETAEPPASGAVDVSAYDEVDFSSPSGGIACKMSTANGGWALCHFPPEMDISMLPAAGHCEPTSLSAVGAGSDAGWVCSGEALAVPEVPSSFTSWFAATGWDPVTVDNHGYERTVAALPYGSSLVMGDLRCDSRTDGVRCLRADTGAGFKVARAGVVLTGPYADHFTDWH